MALEEMGPTVPHSGCCLPAWGLVRSFLPTSGGDQIYLQVDQLGLCLKPVVSPLDQWWVINIRQQVFRNEQDVPFEEDEILEEELESTTYLIYLKDKVIGTIRYRLVNEAYKIERFAILKDYRDQGLGKKVFLYLVDLIASKFNPCTITLNSQKPVIGFYEKCGFIREGNMFKEAGINHVKMNKVIK